MAVLVPLISNVILFLFNVTPNGDVCTIISHVASIPLSVLAVITAFPFFIGIIFPPSTSTILGSLLFHVIFAFTFAVFGITIASSFGISVEFMSITNTE